MVLRLLDLIHHVTGVPSHCCRSGCIQAAWSLHRLLPGSGTGRRYTVLWLLTSSCHAGQRLRAWFKNKGDPPHAGWKDKALRPVTRSGQSLHFLRRWHLRSALLCCPALFVCCPLLPLALTGGCLLQAGSLDKSQQPRPHSRRGTDRSLFHGCAAAAAAGLHTAQCAAADNALA